MTIQDMVNARNSQINDEGDDFVVGTIQGLENSAMVGQQVITQQQVIPQTQQQGVVSMTPVAQPVVVEQEQAVVTPEMLVGTVELRLKKEYAKLAEIIATNNDDVILQNLPTHYQLNAKQIRVSRMDVERALGKMNDGRWRMVLMNRKGEVAEFNDQILILGVIPVEADETKEQAQINIRILVDAKADMDTTRNMLGMTQAQFLEAAIKEFADKVRAEMV